MTRPHTTYTPRAPWPAAHLAKLRKEYANTSTDTIADALGRSTRQVYQKAYDLGLKKSAAFMASTLSGRVQKGRQSEGMKATQFKPGSKPWNAGISYQAGGRSVETRFKPGHANYNKQPLGAQRYTKEGYLQTKTTDTGYTPKDWRGNHTLLWEQHHGPLPAQHIVTFKDKNKANITIGNLECISMADNMRRNSVHNLPPEVVQVIQLRAALQHRLSTLTRTHTKKTQTA